MYLGRSFCCLKTCDAPEPGTTQRQKLSRLRTRAWLSQKTGYISGDLRRCARKSLPGQLWNPADIPLPDPPQMTPEDARAASLATTSLEHFQANRREVSIASPHFPCSPFQSLTHG